MKVKVVRWLEFRCLLNSRIVCSRISVGVRYCRKFRVVQGRCFVVVLKQISGISVIGFVVIIYRVFVVFQKVVLLVGLLVKNSNQISVSGSSSQVFIISLGSVVIGVFLWIRLQKLKVRVSISDIQGRLLSCQICCVMFSEVRVIVSYCRGCRCFLSSNMLSIMLISGLMQQFRLVFSMWLLFIVQIQVIQLLVISSLLVVSMMKCCGFWCSLCYQFGCFQNSSRMVLNRVDQIVCWMMIFIVGMCLSSLKQSGNSFQII